MRYEPSTYQHPLDRESLMRVRAIQWIEKLSRALVAEDLEQDFLLLQLSDNVEMRPSSFPEVHRALDRACDVLGLAARPRVFLDSRPEPHSLGLGVDRPLLVLSSGLVELLEEDELAAVIAHEVGHVVHGHSYYQMLVENFAGIDQFTSGIPGMSLASMAVKVPLFDWYRKADLTADRAAFLVAGEVDPVVRAIGKIAGGVRTVAERVPVADLEAQAEELERTTKGLRSGGLRSKATYLLSNLVLQGILRTQPWPALRILEVQSFARSERAAAILRGETPPPEKRASSSGEDLGSSAESLFSRFGRVLQDAARGTMFWTDREPPPSAPPEEPA